MQTIYLDHNIVHYFVLGFPRGVDGGAEREALNRLKGCATVRFAASLWNIAECAAEREVEKLVGFIESLNPLWLSDRLFMEKMEIQNFVYGNFYGKPAAPIPWFNEYVSQMCVTLPAGADAYIGESCIGLATAFSKTEALRTIKDSAVVVPAALLTIQEARHAGKWTREMQKATMQEWFRSLVPTRDPEGNAIPLEHTESIVARMCNSEKEVLKSSRTIRIHDFAMEFRTKDPKRKAERQDAIDLMHWISGVAACDAFVTAEKYLLEASRQFASLRKESSRSHSSISAAAAVLCSQNRDSSIQVDL